MVHEGIILYEIEDDGCLNGVYTNELSPTPGVIYNEIARRIPGNTISDPIAGLYNCFYFEAPSNANTNALLQIDKANSEINVYKVTWLIEDREVYGGVGYRMNARQFAVHYWSA